MEMERLREIIEGGATVGEVAAAMDDPGLMAGRGWDLLDWSYAQAPGMVLFRRVSRPGRRRSPEVVALEERKRAAQEEADGLLAASYHDADARRRRDTAQNRANAAGQELAELLRTNPGPGEAEEAILAAVLAVNAPETERPVYEREALKAADGRYPMAVVMGRS